MTANNPLFDKVLDDYEKAHIAVEASLDMPSGVSYEELSAHRDGMEAVIETIKSMFTEQQLKRYQALI